MLFCEEQMIVLDIFKNKSIIIIFNISHLLLQLEELANANRDHRNHLDPAAVCQSDRDLGLHKMSHSISCGRYKLTELLTLWEKERSVKH